MTKNEHHAIVNAAPGADGETLYRRLTQLDGGTDNDPGDSWLISYTDMVTLLIIMFLFMLAHSVYVRTSEVVVPRLLYESLKGGATLSVIDDPSFLPPAPLADLNADRGTLALLTALRESLSMATDRFAAKVDITGDILTLRLPAGGDGMPRQALLRRIAPLLADAGDVPVSFVVFSPADVPAAMDGISLLRREGVASGRMRVILPAATDAPFLAPPGTHIRLVVE